MEYVQLNDFPSYEINRNGIIRNIKTKQHRTNITRSAQNNKLRAGDYHWQYAKGGDDL